MSKLSIYVSCVGTKAIIVYSRPGGGGTPLYKLYSMYRPIG